MPKFYRWPVHIFQLNREKKWVLINREVPLSSSAWSMTQDVQSWQIQFSIEEAAAAVELVRDLIAPHREGEADEPMTEENKGSLMNALSRGVTLKGAQPIGGNLAKAVRVVSVTDQSESDLAEALEKKVSARSKPVGHVAFVLVSGHK